MKLYTDVYRSPAVLTLDDEAEVFLYRAYQYSGDQETNGFVPAEAVPLLMRKPTAARVRRVTWKLINTGLLEVAPGGWLLADWDSGQSSLEKERVSNRERQRRFRRRKAESQSPLDDLMKGLSEAGVGTSFSTLDMSIHDELVELVKTRGVAALVKAAVSGWDHARGSPRHVAGYLPLFRNVKAPPPAWCGECDERSRLVEVMQEGRLVLARCPACHPKSISA